MIRYVLIFCGVCLLARTPVAAQEYLLRIDTVVSPAILQPGEKPRSTTTRTIEVATEPGRRFYAKTKNSEMTITLTGTIQTLPNGKMTAAVNYRYAPSSVANKQGGRSLGSTISTTVPAIEGKSVLLGSAISQISSNNAAPPRLKEEFYFTLSKFTQPK